MLSKHTAYELSDWQGYMTHAEIDELKNIVSSIHEVSRTPIFVNIGAGAGTSTIAMLEAHPGAIVFSIDIEAKGNEIYTNEHLRLEEWGEPYLRRVKRIWGDSKLVGLNWPIKVDLVFVDGNHDKNGCASDIRAWIPHIKKGGYMLFHDYGSPNWSDVKVEVDDLMSKHGLDELISVVDTLACFRIK
jgi:predicted O-methyltransferase YrrM